MTRALRSQPRRPRRRPAWLAPALLAGLAASPLAAQQPGPDTAPCEEGRISSVFVDNHSVFDLTDPDMDDRLGWAYRLANSLHVPTREGVVRRELLFREGDCYDVERLRDSERLLRELSFIADVDIFGIRQPDGTVHVLVDTQDEWSTRVEPRLGSGGALGLTGLRLREDNLLGTGQQISAFYLSDEEEQVYGLSYFDPQLLDTRWDASLDAGRTPVGYLLSEAVTYPFVGQFGRWAFHQSARHSDHYFEFRVPGADRLVAVWYPERRQAVELGFAYRQGDRGYNRTLLGAALVGEWVSYPDEPRLAREEQWVGLPPEMPWAPMDSVSSVRAMLMTGQRNVYFVRRRALDTVNGTEDVRLGVESEVAIGPSIPGLSTDRDLALEFGLFAGEEFGERALAGAHLVLEARRRYDAPAERSEWSDVFVQLNAWTYWRPSPESRHTWVGSLAAAGGWHNQVPFQLTLGARTGLRGYEDHVLPGGRRIVASLEHRSYLGWPLPDLLDVGTAAFVDVGRIWAGDAPFGIDSNWAADVGVGLRAAFPPGSRQTFRVDVGMPLVAGAGFGDLVFSVGMGQVIGRRSVVRDPQLGRSTRRGLSTSMFIFPEHP